jgi:hypothetical protein
MSQGQDRGTNSITAIWILYISYFAQVTDFIQRQDLFIDQNLQESQKWEYFIDKYYNTAWNVPIPMKNVAYLCSIKWNSVQNPRKLFKLVNSHLILENFAYRHKMEQHPLKNVNNCLNTNLYSYLETSGSQSYSPYKHCSFLNTRAD